ncbi:mitochondrial matrix iron-sulfur protein [Dimargaris cristalligena]|nr:mitochondrial matrix iron-sulfur protein [Dimargaris cristalligena]
MFVLRSALVRGTRVPNTLPSRPTTAIVPVWRLSHSWSYSNLAPVSRNLNAPGLIRAPAKWVSKAKVRSLHATSAHRHGSAQIPPEGEGLSVTFITPEGEKKQVRCYEGDTLLEIAHANNIDLEGACEASLACSTCHIIMDPEDYDKLEEPSDEENDMLDLAFGLTETSRLGCQVVMTKDLDGLVVRMPSATRNMAVDGFKPKPH